MPRYTVENTIMAATPMNATVLLDGVEMRECIEADTDAGYIIRARRDEAGLLVLDGEELATERLEGVVTVNLAPST